jgi:hypothetical protein
LIARALTEPDQVSRIGKAHDLAPAVNQDLVKSYGTGLHAEHVGRGVAFDELELLGLHAAQRRLRASARGLPSGGD